MKTTERVERFGVVDVIVVVVPPRLPCSCHAHAQTSRCFILSGAAPARWNCPNQLFVGADNETISNLVLHFLIRACSEVSFSCYRAEVMLNLGLKSVFVHDSVESPSPCSHS